MGFFYISAPYIHKARDATVREIKQGVCQKKLAEGKEITPHKEKFKLANLDTLMLCNDKLLKLESGVESFLKKVDKQYCDLQDKQSSEWFVRSGDKEMPVEKFLFEFVWNDSKYSRSYPLPRIVETLDVKLNNMENELRTNTNSYNETKAQLSQATQKEGNYYVKDLHDVLVQPNVSPKDFIYTKFVTTVIVIVPVSQTDEFLGNYEIMTDNVVPYSAKKLSVPEKDGLAIWKVNLFTAKLEEDRDFERDNDRYDDEENKGDRKKKEKKDQTPVQEFMEKAREKKAIVKEFKFESGLSEQKRAKRQGLESKLKNQVKTLSSLCLTYFAEMYELYIHAKILRLIIETNMRFGNDPTVFYVINSVAGKEKIVQGLLVDIFGDKESEGLYGTKDEIDDGEDFFPFIYVPAMTL